MLFTIIIFTVHLQKMKYMSKQVGRPKSEPTKVIGFRVPFCQIKEVQELVRNYLHKKKQNEKQN